MAGSGKFPGSLDYWHRGSYVVAIHADWPTYPPPGADLALYDLGQFPDGTEFFRIDEIDQCTLLRAAVGKIFDDPYDDRGFHVAIWNSDLLELADKRLISGVKTVTKVDKLRAQRAEMADDISKQLAREGIEVPGDPLASLVFKGDIEFSLAGHWDERIREAEAETDEDEDEWDSWQQKYVLVHREQPLRLTHAGWNRVAEGLADESAIGAHDRLSQLYDLGFYDTAIRDGSVMLESAVKHVTGGDAYGMSLVETFIKKLKAEGQWPEWEVRRFRSDLRTIFKFVRNQFAHEISEVPPIRAKVLLDRISLLIGAVLETELRPKSD